MADDTKNQPWGTLAEAAAMVGVTRAAFHQTYRPLLPEIAIRSVGKRGVEVNLAVLHAIVVKRAVDKAERSTVPGDPLLAGGDSPALERYRLARAKMAEKDLAERERTMVQVAILQRAMRQALPALRGTGDRLVRLFGNEAGEIYNEGVNEFETAAIAAIGDDGTGDNGRNDADPGLGGGDADAAAADDR